MNKLGLFVISGKIYTDEREELEFYNDFGMSPIKGVYFTSHSDTEAIRALQGHTNEGRWFISVKGSFIYFKRLC